MSGIKIGDYEVIHELSAEDDLEYCISETWKLDGLVHRDGAPAIIFRDITTGQTVREEWYQHGKMHREGAPAVVQNDGDGRDWPVAFSREEWLLNGLLHRDGAPAILERRSDNGMITEEGWYQNGERHREGKPAWVIYDTDTGYPDLEVWCINGLWHRDDGPCDIEYHPMGVPRVQSWSDEFCQANPDHPQRVVYSPAGEIKAAYPYEPDDATRTASQLDGPSGP